MQKTLETMPTLAIQVSVGGWAGQYQLFATTAGMQNIIYDDMHGQVDLSILIAFPTKMYSGAGEWTSTKMNSDVALSAKQASVNVTQVQLANRRARSSPPCH